jgi:hypothetical protein
MITLYKKNNPVVWKIMESLGYSKSGIGDYCYWMKPCGPVTFIFSESQKKCGFKLYADDANYACYWEAVNTDDELIMGEIIDFESQLFDIAKCDYLARKYGLSLLRGKCIERTTDYSAKM